VSRLAAFSKYLAHGLGGAEKSTFALLEQEHARGRRILLCAAGSASFGGRALRIAAHPRDWELRTLDHLTHLPRYAHLEYALNRARIARWFAGLDADELWTYGLLAPAAWRGFAGPVKYFVRSESDLGVVENYQSGLRTLVKSAHTAVQWPALAVYRADLRAMARSVDIVANSEYMASRVATDLGASASVSLPRVDVAGMRAALAAAPEAPTWVVFVGDSVWKGVPIALTLARRLPHVRFRVVTRLIDRERDEANVRWMPWSAEEWRVYAGARLVIVPSQCAEAYGRVAREAFLLGLPVLASRVGGLPEAVDQRPECLVDDFRRADAWEAAVRHALRESATMRVPVPA
jgi:glycosyltransferase involved in cell wall biosynthesis